MKDLKIRPEIRNGKKFLDSLSYDFFFGYEIKSTDQKTKNKQVELHQTEQFQPCKGNKMKRQRFHWWFRGEESAFQCRRHEFDL